MNVEKSELKKNEVYSIKKLHFIDIFKKSVILTTFQAIGRKNDKKNDYVSNLAKHISSGLYIYLEI